MQLSDWQPQLRELLERCRGRLAPAELGLPSRPARGPGLRAPGLSQQDMDDAMHQARGTYQKFETGRRRKKETYVDEVGKVLRMAEKEYQQMYLLVFGRLPSHSLNPRTRMVVPDVWKEIVQSTRHISYITDGEWEVIAGNRAYREVFFGDPPSNLMHWMLFSEEARSGTLECWGTRWAPFMLPQLRAAHIENPNSETLTALHEQALEDTRTGPIYRRESEGYTHPDGDVRPLRHPVLGRGTTVLAVANPLSSPGAHFVVAPFTPLSKETEGASRE